ncbi:MAG: hypothetical protein AAGC74_05355 [Verrucomicrobiota bacterium]
MKTSFVQAGVKAFALPAVLVMTTGLLVLLTALMTVVDLERSSARSRTDGYRAELAVESAFEEAKTILAEVGSTDSYVIVEAPLGVNFDDNDDGQITSEEDDLIDTAAGETGRPYLYAYQGEANGSGVTYRILPLFSTEESPSDLVIRSTEEARLPEKPGLPSDSQGGLDPQVALRAVPYKGAPVTAWRVVRDVDDRPVARYAYWVEDMQGYLDAELVPGNMRGGGHRRANEVWGEDSMPWNDLLAIRPSQYRDEGGVIPLWPAPGVNPGYRESVPGFGSPNEKMLSEVPVYLLDRNSEGLLDTTNFDDILREYATRAPTPGSLLALSGVAEAPLERAAAGPDRGRLVDAGVGNFSQARAIEELITVGNRAWEETALVPFAPGLEGSVMGRAQLNLNRLLGNSDQAAFGPFGAGERAIQQAADLIERALPDFDDVWKGGLPDAADYNKSLIAAALDYADEDDTPKVKESGGGDYRGIDAHPMISEFVIHFDWIGFQRTDGNLYLTMEVEIFAELWNMSNHRISGSVELGYENYFTFPALGNPAVGFMDALSNQEAGGFQSWTEHDYVQKDDGFYYSSPQQVDIEPNGYLLVRGQPIKYWLYVGDASDFMPEPIPTISGDDGQSRYRLHWNGVLSDRSGGGMERPAITRLSRSESKSKAQVCGTWGPYGAFYTGMGDLRQSWWAGVNETTIEGIVSENSYPQNYSPGRRNVRYGSLSGRPNEPYARVLPSEWPDGGHDTSFDVRSFHREGSSNRGIHPYDPKFVGNGFPSDAGKAPVFLSNLGRFFSETELGNAFDPAMWKGDANPGLSIETWPYRDTGFDGTVEITQEADPAEHVGGGSTLRIGRGEHSRFDRDGVRATHLLDLFHCGIPLSNDVARQQGNLRRVEGHVNINTAPREVLRIMAAGTINSDPKMARQGGMDTRTTYAPRASVVRDGLSATDAIEGVDESVDDAGLIADEIIANRPYFSLAQLGSLRFDSDTPGPYQGQPVFGNKLHHGPGERLQRSDRAAEEVFARFYNSATTRSRNFRVHVIGQALEQTLSGRYRVKATRKKSYRVFVDPGERSPSEAGLDRANVRVETLYETNL